MNNPRILTVKNAKFSGYHFNMNLNIWGDFQFCISVPLTQYNKIIKTCTDRIEGVDKICWSAGMKFQTFQLEFHPTVIWGNKFYHSKADTFPPGICLDFHTFSFNFSLQACIK